MGTSYRVNSMACASCSAAWPSASLLLWKYKRHITQTSHETCHTGWRDNNYSLALAYLAVFPDVCVLEKLRCGRPIGGVLDKNPTAFSITCHNTQCHISDEQTLANCFSFFVTPELIGTEKALLMEESMSAAWLMINSNTISLYLVINMYIYSRCIIITYVYVIHALCTYTHVVRRSCSFAEYLSPTWGQSPSTILNITPMRPWPSNACLWQHSSNRMHPMDLPIEMNVLMNAIYTLVEVLGNFFV